MFRSRLELIAYFIQAITDAPMKECEQEAIKYDSKPFILRWTVDI